MCCVGLFSALAELYYGCHSLKVLSVGLNPTDYKHVDTLSKPGTWLGCDFVGEVVELGPAVPNDQVKKGEIRWSFIRGGVSKKGAFSE